MKSNFLSLSKIVLLFNGNIILIASIFVYIILRNVLMYRDVEMYSKSKRDISIGMSMVRFGRLFLKKNMNSNFFGYFIIYNQVLIY